MRGADLVTSFYALSLVADEYPTTPPRDHSEQARRDGVESAATLATFEHGERGLVEWVARKWQARFPAAMACGEQGTEIVFARTPGMSVIANYELCRGCSAFFTSPE